jgi:hypothetical protein
MQNNLVATVVGAVILVGGFVLFQKNPEVNVSVPVSAPESAPQSLAGASGPTSYFPCETHNGVGWCFNREGLRAANVTVCSVRSPAATSTLESATVLFQSVASYAATFQMGWGASNTATTTRIAELTVGAGVKFATLIATTSATALTDGVVPPNSFINVNVATGSVSSTFAPVGTCDVVFRVI